ncbi:hypothetical protein FKR81_32570 [Lentzea tibetensis]|uniref:Uncharacterized protein n=1 Tax=Lentzea tibetensis TaxID=2591470 RepID=A0A563EK68_9PSEU|nr:hypothetical protein [Lentzea tibetensis]TWP47444.1 hypothetical protein FKR81_32570 [Lentzea tibetensis]
MREDDLRATFDALHAKGTPARPFEAADIIREGGRQRRAHRTWAVIGTGLATAAAVVAALLLLPSAPAPEPVLPADPPTPSSSFTVPPTPTAPPAPNSSQVVPSGTPPGSHPAPNTTAPQQPPTSIPATF